MQHSNISTLPCKEKILVVQSWSFTCTLWSSQKESLNYNYSSFIIGMQFMCKLKFKYYLIVDISKQTCVSIHEALKVGMNLQRLAKI